MERKGKKLAVLADGHPRRLADGRNAWRKMSNEQRLVFLEWLGFRDFHAIDAVELLRQRSWQHSDKGGA